MAFITQVPRQRASNETRDEIAELEALVSGVTQTSQSTLLLKKKKEMREVNDSLAFMKSQYLERMQSCDEKHSVFERKQMDMKEQVVKFEKFIQENDSKRQRAEMRAKDEQRKVEQKKSELNQLRKELEEQTIERGKLESRLNKLSKYKIYLDGTVDATDDFEQIDDILNRLTTLEGANYDLMGYQKSGDSEMDEVRIELENYLMETQNHQLVQNSKVHNYQFQLEKLRAEAKLSQDREENKQDRVQDVNRETGQMIMAVRNLYGRCCSTTKTKMPRFENSFNTNFGKINQCLTFICERIVDLNEVVVAYKNEEAEADMLPPIPYHRRVGEGEGGVEGAWGVVGVGGL
ncbi:hypothetical protein ScalyP_jg7472 [Parmales sp. scaly parma]|nr:hypothetical protein ScalyP_jg7472 [Parmales sp. scaly parma]